jgi:hypothetical protein
MEPDGTATTLDDAKPVKTTLQLQPSLRRWYKAYAATKDVTLYDLINGILLDYAKARGYTGELGIVKIDLNAETTG